MCRPGSSRPERSSTPAWRRSALSIPPCSRGRTSMATVRARRHARSMAGSRVGRCAACRSASRTSSTCRGCRPPAARDHSRTRGRPPTPRRWRDCARRARSSSARRTPRSSRSAIRRRRAIRGISRTRRAGRRRARRPPWPPAWFRWRSALRRWARCCAPPRTAGSSGSSRRTGWCPRTASSRSRGRSTTSACSRARCSMSPWCWAC